MQLNGNQQPNWLKKKIASARNREDKKENERKRISDQVEQYIVKEGRINKLQAKKEEREDQRHEQPDLLNQLSLALLAEFKREEDVFSLFCQSIAPRLKTLPKSASRQVMKIILEEVSKAEEHAE